MFLLQHLRSGLEAFVLEQALDELAARIVVGAGGDGERVAREQGLRLDVDEQRGNVDKLARGVDVSLLEIVRVGEELRGDARDRDVVDVDVLLANQVKQQVERTVIDPSDSDGERRL